MSNKGFEGLILEHFKRRPKMTPSDVYKLLFQGVFGVGHILGEGIWERLEEEIASIQIDTFHSEPLFERVSVDGSMIRVNLRPYVKKRLPLKVIYNAMKLTVKETHDPTFFYKGWEIFKRLVHSGLIDTEVEELEILDQELNYRDPLPHHHSQIYRENYYPAYRVVDKIAMKEALNEFNLTI
jgi:hypothetical protein